MPGIDVKLKIFKVAEMEQYKLINAELMDQVQNQRITIAEMLKTEVSLRKQLLEEHELRLADAQYNEQKLKCAIRTLLHSLDINLDSCEYSTSSRSSKSSEDLRSSPFNNGQVCTELRRSSGILQRALPVSPIRRSWSSVSSCNQSQGEDRENSTTTMSPCSEGKLVRKTLEPRHLVEMQTNISSPEVDERESADQLSFCATQIYSIIEESDSEYSNLSFSMESNETMKSSCSGSTVEISPLPLSNVTNNQKRVRLIPSVKITKECSPSESTETKIEKYNLRQNKSKKMILETRLDLAVPTRSPIQITLPCTSINTNALTPRRALNDMTNRPRDFSTPHKEKQNLNAKRSSASIKAEVKPKKISCSSRTDESSMEDSTVGRPRRSCRPSSLKEPNCRSKLRCETKSK